LAALAHGLCLPHRLHPPVLYLLRASNSTNNVKGDDGPGKIGIEWGIVGCLMLLRDPRKEQRIVGGLPQGYRSESVV
jgi:hypothetical protein